MRTAVDTSTDFNDASYGTYSSMRYIVEAFAFTTRPIDSKYDNHALLPAGCLSSIESDPASVVVPERELQAFSPTARPVACEDSTQSSLE
jgi:hypothetical protein